MLIVLLNGSDNFDWLLQKMGMLRVQCSGVQQKARASNEFFPEL